MARILPRLLGRLERKSQPVSLNKFVLPRKHPRSLHRPLPPPPSFRAADHPRSILLYDPPSNPITASRVYLRHKTLPPLPRQFDKPRITTENDQPRAMTREERQFWSSPYLRMIASPLRQCIITGRFFPKDFLIRLAVVRIPTSHCPSKQKRAEASQTLLPDGLQHTKFTLPRSCKAHYLPCTRAAVALLSDSSVKRRTAYGIKVHSLLAEQVAHLLRLRVLQELELLADNLEASAARPHRGNKPTLGPRLLRRLSHDELHTIRTTQTIPHPGALAVLIVPPLQKDPSTGQRPTPNMSPAPPPPDDAPPPKNLVTMPGCVLYPTQPRRWEDKQGDGVLPEERVPLYNSVAMFPERGQRAALEERLRRVLKLEWSAGHKHVPSDGKEVEVQEINGGEEKSKWKKSKTSHAFLLCSDEESVLRGDTVGVAIALWRLRMFEDKGEDIETQSTDGWEWTTKQKI